jgi:nitrilase
MGDGMERMIIAAAHCSSVFLNRDQSVAKACDFIRQAAERGVCLVCFPETFIPGFPYWINLYPPARQHAAYVRYLQQSVDLQGACLHPVREAAAQANITVALGISERQGATMYNTQVFIGPDGSVLGKHRKLQPTFAERMLWAPGDGSTLSVLPTPIGRVGGLICYEHMMNLARQALIEQHEQIHCASWPTFASIRQRGAGYDDLVETLMRAHAITAQCFVIVAQNPVTQNYLDTMEDMLGCPDGLEVGGGCSTIYGPNGATLAGPHKGLEETLVTAEIDLDDILAAKVLVDTAGHYSRPEVLTLCLNRTPFRTLRENRGDSEEEK